MHPNPQPVSFLTVEAGTPVVDRFGAAVGAVHRWLLLEDGGFDGIVVDTESGRRFVDAPRCAESRAARVRGRRIDDRPAQ